MITTQGYLEGLNLSAPSRHLEPCAAWVLWGGATSVYAFPGYQPPRIALVLNTRRKGMILSHALDTSSLAFAPLCGSPSPLRLLLVFSGHISTSLEAGDKTHTRALLLVEG